MDIIFKILGEAVLELCIRVGLICLGIGALITAVIWAIVAG